ncbi:MAG: RagB/SusD family nutrient uptake outer membrane protein, partial [Odoribacter sp.]|nr:RagB/SusD family nutrient uptake outer membrane protein [Odoribacter sp.]
LRLFGPSPVANDKSSVQLPYSEKSGKELVAYYPYDAYVEKIWTDLNRADSLLKAVDPVQRLTFEELNNPNTLLKNYKIIDNFQCYRRVRFNYWALKAFKARVALYLGDNQTAYENAMVVINARVADKPVGDMSVIIQDINAEWYTLPSETLFAINAYDLIDKVQNIFKNTQNVLYKYETETELQKDLFENQSSDYRLKLWTDMSYKEQRQVSIKKYWQVDEKEEKEAITYGQQIPILRMSEVYLIAVETAPSLSEGNEKLDIFRKDRGLLTKNCSTYEELKYEVLKEYQKEFYAEGQMFFTYKRIGAKEMIGKENRPIELSEYRIPLPETEFSYQ